MVKNMTFESAMTRLDEITKMLDSNKTTINEAMQLYDESVSLIRFCNEQLQSAEQKIEIIKSDDIINNGN